MGDQGRGPLEQRVGEDGRRALLRQLAVGLSVHRLYPNDPGAPAFVAACTRIREQAAQAVAGGPVHVELRSGHLVLDDDRDDQGLERLAQACFERRVEHLYVVHPPAPDELSALFTTLSTDPTDVEAAGGVATLLERAGVRSMLATEEDPAAAQGEELPEHLASIAAWTEVVADEAVEQALAIRLAPDDDAGSLYARLREAGTSLPEDATARSPFYRHADALLAELPATEQPVFGRLVLDAARSETFAERFLGHLTDHRLAELLVRVAEHEGTHPAVLARELGSAGGRGASLPRLTLDLVSGPAPPWSAPPPTGVHPLVAAFPANADQGRALALTALLDVLLHQPRPEHLEAIVQAATGQLRADLLAGDLTAVVELLTTLDWVRELTGAGRDHPLQRPWSDALDAETVAGLAAEAAAAGDPRRLDHLRPFGAEAIPPLLTVLSADPAPAVRGVVNDTLVRLVPDHLDVVYLEISRQPPEALAQLADVLGRIGGSRVLALLGRLCHHPSALVLLPTIDALAGQHATAAVPLLAAITARTDDRDVQARCVDAIARHGGREGSQQLHTFARRSSSPLPFRLRRRAARAARRSRP